MSAPPPPGMVRATAEVGDAVHSLLARRREHDEAANKAAGRTASLLASFAVEQGAHTDPYCRPRAPSWYCGDDAGCDHSGCVEIRGLADCKDNRCKLLRAAGRIADCRAKSHVVVHRCDGPDEQPKSPKVALRQCHARACPRCARADAGTTYRSMLRAFEVAEVADPVMLTLTAPSQPLDAVPDFRRLMRAWSQQGGSLRRWKAKSKGGYLPHPAWERWDRGGVCALEVTVSRHGFHDHLHLVLDRGGAYVTEADYIDLAMAWHGMTGCSSSCVPKLATLEHGAAARRAKLRAGPAWDRESWMRSHPAPEGCKAGGSIQFSYGQRVDDPSPKRAAAYLAKYVGKAAKGLMGRSLGVDVLGRWALAWTGVHRWRRWGWAHGTGRVPPVCHWCGEVERGSFVVRRGWPEEYADALCGGHTGHAAQLVTGLLYLLLEVEEGGAAGKGFRPEDEGFGQLVHAVASRPFKVAQEAGLVPKVWGWTPRGPSRLVRPKAPAPTPLPPSSPGAVPA